ncbi:MAG: protein kinase [Burkholderiales bacterium]|nr:protein kinase [Burkholderiales bacterium]
MSPVLAPATAPRLGRFEVKRELGRGAQSTVYLALDTHLGREVALKTLDLTGLAAADAAAVTRTLLDEARIVGTLQHPNIVTLHDAVEHGGAPFLVLERVEGVTLAEMIRRDGRVPVHQAVDIAAALARGVGYAHYRDVVHRDLKPANVIVTPEGVARLTDFGIARRGVPGDAPDSPFTGTPLYMAPEYVADRTFTPATDLYGLGLILYEMLTGERPLSGAGPREVMHRIVHEPVRPPSEANPEVDERLDAIVLKLLAKRPEERYPNASALAAALTAWLDPEAPQPPVPGAGTQATVEFLLRRIRHKSDFPALSTTIGAVNRAATGESQPASVLCEAILKDFALTNRLLKLVNAARYGQYGGAIGTVSRAVSILGFDGVRNVAASLLLFDHLQNKAGAGALREELVAGYYAGLLTRELAAAAGVREVEQAFICAMFHRLGRLMVIFYLHDEAQAIAGLVQARGWEEERAAREVLGLSYEDLGAEVGRAWYFPEAIVASMRPLPERVTERPRLEEERLHALAALADAVTRMVRNVPARERGARMTALVERYGRATGATDTALAAAIEAAAVRFDKDAQLMGFGAGRSALLDNARGWNAAAAVADAQAAAEPDPGTLVTGGAGPVGTGRLALLAAAVEEAGGALVGEGAAGDALRMVLEGLHRAGGFQRVLLFLLDPAANALRCRAGFGADAETFSRRGASVPLGGPRDLFSTVLQQGADICIEDIDTEKLRPYVPDWHRKAMRARGVVLLPLASGKRALGLLYADVQAPDALRFRPEELSLLKTLRNQALLAMRQRG